MQKKKPLSLSIKNLPKMNYSILPIFIPFLGCSHQCTYCNQNAITGENITFLTDSVKKQIELWKPRLTEIKEAAFYGGTFTKLPAKIRIKLYQMVKPYNIRVSTCPDGISREFLNEIDEYNIKTIEFGVQSLSDKVLSANKRYYYAKQVQDIFGELNKKVKLSAQFMTGMYQEEREDAALTADLMKNLNADYTRIYPTMVLKDTELEHLYKKGLFQPNSAKEMILRTSLYYTSALAASSKVIRTGLPPEVNNSNISAGAWHPALGDIIKTFMVCVYASIYNELPNIEYNGYKAFIKKNFSLRKNIEINSFEKTASKIMEYYNESNKWFTEKQNASIANELADETDFR